MIRCNRNVGSAVFDHAQHRLENAAHGRDVPSLLIPCGGQRVVVPEQLVRSVDQMNVHKATPARNYRNPPISINRHRATTSDRPLTSGNRDRVTNRLKKNLPLPVFDSRGDLNRKSTRLNSSHGSISYAVFCLKKKKKTQDVINYFDNLDLRFLII